MADVHDRQTRSRNMAAIRGRDTAPELTVRKALHAAGLRYRLNDTSLPGKPDLVFPRYHAVLFVHGCFWHQHDCRLFRLPATRQEFWKDKLDRNASRDIRTTGTLISSGWRVGTIWECALKGPGKCDFDTMINALKDWVQSEQSVITIRGG